MLVALCLCYPPHALHRLISRGPSPWVKRFLWLAGRAAGLRVRQEGQFASGSVLLVANHVSWLDILLLGGVCGSAFVSKAEVSGWPVLGWLARQGDTVFIERAERSAVGAQAALLSRALGVARPVTLFAEATTGDGVSVRAFSSSLFAAVAGSAIPIQPVAIRYAVPARVAWPEEEGAAVNALRLLRSAGRIDATVSFLPPLDASGNRKALAAAARDAIVASLAG